MKKEIADALDYTKLRLNDHEIAVMDRLRSSGLTLSFVSSSITLIKDNFSQDEKNLIYKGSISPRHLLFNEMIGVDRNGRVNAPIPSIAGFRYFKEVLAKSKKTGKLSASYEKAVAYEEYSKSRLAMAAAEAVAGIFLPKSFRGKGEFSDYYWYSKSIRVGMGKIDRRICINIFDWAVDFCEDYSVSCLLKQTTHHLNNGAFLSSCKRNSSILERLAEKERRNLLHRDTYGKTGNEAKGHNYGLFRGLKLEKKITAMEARGNYLATRFLAGAKLTGTDRALNYVKRIALSRDFEL